MDNDRTTQELIELLGQDCDRCHAQLIATIDAGHSDDNGEVDADYGFDARKLVRAILAYIEAVTYSVKHTSTWQCIEQDIEITPQERYFATDTEYELDDRGQLVETVAKVSLSRNSRFAL